jgi:hypothetical protein
MTEFIGIVEQKLISQEESQSPNRQWQYPSGPRHLGYTEQTILGSIEEFPRRLLQLHLSNMPSRAESHLVH